MSVTEEMRANKASVAQRHLLAHLTSAVLMRSRRIILSSCVFPISHSGVGRKGDTRMIMPRIQNGGNTKKNDEVVSYITRIGKIYLIRTETINEHVAR